MFANVFNCLNNLLQKQTERSNNPNHPNSREDQVETVNDLNNSSRTNSLSKRSSFYNYFPYGIITTEQGLDNVGKEDKKTDDEKENKGKVHETIIPENIDQNKQESDSGVSSDKSEYYKELVKGLVEKQRELEQKVDELESKIGTAEEERDFYFEKLRDIEDFCDYVSPPSEEIQVTTEPDDDVPNGFTVIENVRERLYAEREGFCAPTLAQDDDENSSGKLVEDFQFKLKNSSSRDKFTSEESYRTDELNENLNEDFEFNDCKKMEHSSKIESLSSLSF